MKEPTTYNILCFSSLKQPTAEVLAREIKKFGNARFVGFVKMPVEGRVEFLYELRFEN